MATYTLTSYKDVYTLTNTGVIDITYTLSKLADCYNYTEISTGTLAPAELSTITPVTDGEYKLEITDATLTVNTETIIYFVNLITSFVYDVVLIVCGCAPDCTESYSDDALTLAAYNKMLTTYSFMWDDFNVAIGITSNEIKCLMMNPIQCLQDSEKILGISSSSLLNKQLISLYYLAFYFTEKGAAIDQDEIDYIALKYKYSSIAPCLSQLGINLNSIENLIIP